jgi:uncharacterized membrane protein
MNPTIAIVALLLLNTSTVWAEDIITPKDLSFKIYLDKSTLVTYTVLVSPSQVKVTIPVPGSSYSDVLVSDSNGAPLRFNVTNDSISVITIGTSSISMTYITTTLVSSIGGLMTFNVTTNTPSTRARPRNHVKRSTDYVSITRWQPEPSAH